MSESATDFVITREFDAPRELVFKCWLEPQHLAQWWGPNPVSCPVCEVDARPDGLYRIVMHTDGKDYPMGGRIVELVPPARIVQTVDVSEHSEDWFDAIFPGRDRAKGKPRVEILETVTLEDLGGGRTRLTVRQRFGKPEHRDAFVKGGLEWGFGQSLDKLASLLVTLAASESEIAVSRLIGAPRAKVFAAFFDKENIGHWWGPDGFTTTTKSMDARVGGQWLFTMHGWGKDWPNRVIYREIIHNERIVTDHDGGEGGDPTHAFKAVITFVDERGGTRVTNRMFLANAGRKADLVKFGAVKGGQQNLARLDRHLAAG
jgi:uncharacterized protein YndB with AHSA1/START domain